jgi:hypothetical protein
LCQRRQLSQNPRQSELGCAHGSPLLEALPAKNRAAWNRGVFAALRTSGFGFRAHLGVTTPSARTDAFSAFGFASFASFWFVFETLVGKKHLFAGRKHKFRRTFRTLQDLIVEFHEPPPWPESSKGMGAPCTIGPGYRIP